jgi:GNAT superfamily N-acetyltransferase
MQGADRDAVLELLCRFLRGDEVGAHADAYGGTADAAAVLRALELFEDNPAIGFVWVALDGEAIVGVITVCFTISSNLGSLVAKIVDFVVAEHARGKGVGRMLLHSLIAELSPSGVGRIDLGVHDSNVGARRFYERVGFRQNYELGLSLLL